MNTPYPKIPTLRKFVTSMPIASRADFAGLCGTSIGHLEHIYNGHRGCNPVLAIEIDKHSGGAVKCDELRPDADFDYIRRQAIKDYLARLNVQIENDNDELFNSKQGELGCG